MSIETYGIYVGYSPNTDLRKEGLGRYLASFLKGAAERADVRFVIACPSWAHDTLIELFESERVPAERFRICSPGGKPYLLEARELYERLVDQRSNKPSGGFFGKTISNAKERLKTHLKMRLVSSNSFATLLPILIEILLITPLLLLLTPVVFLYLILRAAAKVMAPVLRWVKKPIVGMMSAVEGLFQNPRGHSWTSEAFILMVEHEFRRMNRMVQDLKEVRAWYCPTAFWPAFNEIDKPRLMCVPDVVMNDFAVGFSGVGGDLLLESFETLEKAILGADNLVTYSERTKWDTLVDAYGIPAERAFVIPHAPQSLSRWVAVKDFPDNEATSRTYCKILLRQAFNKSVNSDRSYASWFQNADVRFLFYASQFRPNKNVLTLLRAYKELLRNRLVGHKLILTGLLSDMPEYGEYLVDEDLENDVLCLWDLNVSELAACYKLADLAVNPSLSEGGFPFTFSEALSVNTPVVMARIDVSEEVISDPAIQEVTFFDPYDWRDVADRICWALQNKTELLSAQTEIYEQLKARTWTDVVDDHVQVLRKIST